MIWGIVGSSARYSVLWLRWKKVLHHMYAGPGGNICQGLGNMTFRFTCPGVGQELEWSSKRKQNQPASSTKKIQKCFKGCALLRHPHKPKMLLLARSLRRTLFRRFFSHSKADSNASLAEFVKSLLPLKDLCRKINWIPTILLYHIPIFTLQGQPRWLHAHPQPTSFFAFVGLVPS